MKTTLVCPCGELIRGTDEDDLVAKTLKHLEDKHPHLVGEYERDQILFLAT